VNGRYRVRGVAITRQPNGVERVLTDGSIIEGELERIGADDDAGTASEGASGPVGDPYAEPVGSEWA
jgi:hypothetical protein